MQDKLNDILETELPTCHQVALTADHWTSRNNDAYMAVTLHYMNKDFVLKKYLLAVTPFPERHTGRNIGEALDIVVRRFDALAADDLVRVAVVDQAANIRSGLEHSEMVESIGSGKEKSYTCTDHRLNTCLMNTVEKIPYIKAAFSAARKLTTRRNHSTLACDQLRTECAALDGKNLKDFSFQFQF